ncbi:MAG TPA: hypothetical protein VMX97_11620, partial [Hyphomicrobiaceae bacterium]|nr:hypothetical protein [Hyphomicrobiaceae bacterium]
MDATLGGDATQDQPLYTGGRELLIERRCVKCAETCFLNNGFPGRRFQFIEEVMAMLAPDKTAAAGAGFTD